MYAATRPCIDPRPLGPIKQARLGWRAGIQLGPSNAFHYDRDMIDPKWLDALKLPLKATIAVALATGALLFLDLKNVLDLGALGSIGRPALIVALVVSIVMSIVNLADFAFAPIRERRHVSMFAARRAVRQQEKDQAVQEKRATILARLDHLSDREIDVVAKCLRSGSPSYYTYIHSPSTSMLQGKGLVWTPGGVHHEDHYPFSFHDFVWIAIQARREEFLAKDEENKMEAAAKARRR